jgi:4-amino-4-deoxy-L-arabinose transferase-like glycosyltransferase
MKPRLSALALPALVALHFALGLVYAWATPALEASDEGSHFGVVQWIARGNGLPVQDPRNKETFYHQEGSQPPLYYVIGAALTFWMDTSDHAQVAVQNPLSRVGIPGTTHNVNLYRPIPADAMSGTAQAVLALRLFSLLLSCGTVALTLVLARRLFTDKLRPLLAAALVAFNPMALFINASVNNDNLLMLLATATLLVTVDLVQAHTRPSVLKLAGLGSLCGLAALTKLSGLVLWPVVALGILAEEWKHIPRVERQLPSAIRHLPPVFTRGLIAFGAAILVCGWWFLRNMQLYGELLGLETMVAIAGPRSVGLIELFTQEWASFYLSYWGIFGVFSIRASEWVYWFFDIVTLASIASGLWLVWKQRGRLSSEAALLAIYCVLTFVGVVRWTMQTPASQGRLMFGAIAPLSIGMAAALLAPFAPRAARVAAACLGAALAAVALYVPVFDIAPRYRPPLPIPEAQLPADLRPVRAQFGEGLELIGYTADDEARKPGDAVRVTLYWRVLRRMTTDDSLALVLFGRNDEGVGQLDTWPGSGLLPTSQMRPGAIYADHYLVPVMSTATTPTLLRLRVGLWRDAPENRLPILLPDGAQTDALTLNVGRLSASNQLPSAPEHSDGSTFEYGIELIGYTARVDAGRLTLTLNWRTRERVPADYTLFVHLVDAMGAKLDQADGPPLNGDWPTSAWLPGEAFAETRTLKLPAASAPGCCIVRLGWYDATTGLRLAAFRPDGEPWPENAVVLNVMK